MVPIIHLAPLHGLTTRIFREAYLKYFNGVDLILAPFVLALKDASPADAHFRELGRAGGASATRVVPQVLGNDAEAFIDTARALAELGYGEVNWNLGCPYPMVTRKQRGSALLAQPERVRAFLDRACAGSVLPVSVKLRLGFRDAGELDAILAILNDYPLAGVTLHPRVAMQMYEGRADADAFARALPLSRHPLCYNGDVRDDADYARLSARFPGVRDWMIGRWLVADPFLPARIKGLPMPAAPARVLEAFADELLERYREALASPKHVLDKMKEIWGYLGRSFHGKEEELKELLRAKTLEAYGAAAARITGAR